jgi:hypothetical protein
MKNVLKDFKYRNDLEVVTIVKITGLSQAIIYRLLANTDEQLLKMQVLTKKRLEKIGFNLEEELSKKYDNRTV